MDYNWRPPSDAVTGWMEGKVHHRPPTRREDFRYVNQRRKQAFFQACRLADPDLALWPEFEKRLRELNLLSWYVQGTISMEVAGLLIAARNRRVGSWLARGERLEREGKDPLKRRRYVRAMRELYGAIFEARKLAERRRFVKVASSMYAGQ